MRTEVLLAILAMALAAYLCRVGGFFAMRFVPLTPRVQAWLRAVPMAILGAILAPVAVSGDPAGMGGLACAAIAMRLTGNDFLGVFAGVGAVAMMRAVT